jgi:hypothetical protein
MFVYLDCLAETHFISENAVEIVVIQRHHPLKTLDLVLLELAADKHVRLLRHLLLDTVSDGVVVNLARALLVVVRPM